MPQAPGAFRDIQVTTMMAGKTIHTFLDGLRFMGFFFSSFFFANPLLSLFLIFTVQYFAKMRRTMVRLVL